MATVYSLVCWGGRTGKTVSISATTDVVTLTNHGLRNGTKLWPSDTLPSELNTSTPVYARSTEANTFTLHTSSAGAIANTGQITFAGSSTYAAVVLKSDLIASTSHSALSPYGLSDLSRWGSSGSERIYDSIRSFISARISAALQTSDEIAEFGDAFDDIGSLGVSTASYTGASMSFTSYLNDIRSAAFHGGLPGAAYRMIVLNADNACVTLNSYNILLDGLEFCTNTNTNGTTGIILSGSTGFNAEVKNNIFKALGKGTQPGVNLSQAIKFYNNVVMEFLGTTYGGIYSANGVGVLCYNNLVTKCDIGIRSNGSQGVFHNNLSVGNTVANYSSSPQSLAFRAFGNIGSTADQYDFTVSVGTQTCTCTTRPASVTLQTNSQVFVSSSGSLPTVAGVPINGAITYYVVGISGNTFRLSLTPSGGGVTFDGAGSGTHKISLVWASSSAPLHIDFSTSNDVFEDWTNNDFRPAGTGATPNVKALQVDAYVDVYGVDLTTDIVGDERPNYNNGGFEERDVGPFEYDHGYGPHPTSNYRGLYFSGLVAGSTLKVFDTGSTTELFSDTSTSTTETWSENVSGSRTVDYTILKDGYVPIRVTGIVVTGATSGGVLATPIQQKESRAYQTPSGLSIGTTATINTGTKRFTVTVATTVQNWFSYMQQCWRTEASLKNVAFPISENGPNSFQLSDDWQFSSGVNLLSRDGMRYVNSSGVVTDSWAAILSVGAPTGKQVRYEQTDGGTVVNAANTGNMDQLLKIYENGSFDYTGFLALKVQGDGLDQAEFDAVSTYGTLEDQLYVVGLTPTENGISAGTVTGITITDHGASPVTWNSKAFSITITDTTGHTGEQIVQYVRGLNDFDFHDLVQTNGTEYKTVRGKLYGDTGAALKGVRVVQADGATSHADFNLHTADDGTTYIPPLPPASVSATVLTDTRVQLFNVTTDTEIDNDFITGTSYNYVITTEASAGDTIRLRACKTGREAGEAFGIWSGTPLPLLISQPEDDVYTAWGIDGSTCTEFVGDVTGHIYIDTNDLDGVSQKVRLGAWYSWVLTLDIGIRHFYGAVSYVAVNAIRINTDIADILIENINSTTALRFTDLDVRLYRSDGTSVIAPTSYSIHNDYSGVPDVTVVTVSGANVITGDIADIPIASENAAAVLAALNATTIPCNMVETNGESIIGNGTEGNKFRSHLVG